MKITERIDKHTHVPSDKLILYPPFPDAVKIELTARCNYNCSFCASKRSLRKIGDMDKEFFRMIIPKLKKQGVKEVGLFLLGESFLLKDLVDYIKYTKDCGIEYVFITTNGSLCTPERMIPVIDAGLDSIKFSINAGCRERYYQMHNKDRFDDIIKNVKWLSKYLKEKKITSLKTCVSSIFIKEFEQELDRFKQFMLQYVDDFYFLPLYNQAGHVGNSEYTRIIGNPGRYENMAAPIPCWALFNAFKITWEGWFTACCFDHDTRFNIADLSTTELIDAWHNPKIVKMRSEHLNITFKNDSLCAKCLALFTQTTGNPTSNGCTKCPEYQKK